VAREVALLTTASSSGAVVADDFADDFRRATPAPRMPSRLGAWL